MSSARRLFTPCPECGGFARLATPSPVRDPVAKAACRGCGWRGVPHARP